MVALILTLSTLPTVPLIVADVTTGAADAAVMLIVTFPVPFPDAFVALTITVPLAANEGVPLMTPVVAFKLSPAGQVPVAKA